MTYVINNRIPKFLVKPHYEKRVEYQTLLDNAFQAWLMEKFISNVQRRKVCSVLYDFSSWLLHEGRFIEEIRTDDFMQWCGQGSQSVPLDLGDFLRYARLQIEGLDWVTL